MNGHEYFVSQGRWDYAHCRESEVSDDGRPTRAEALAEANPPAHLPPPAPGDPWVEGSSLHQQGLDEHAARTELGRIHRVTRAAHLAAKEVTP